jgi:hypothetical protein
MAQKVDLSSEYCFIGEGEMTLTAANKKSNQRRQTHRLQKMTIGVSGKLRSVLPLLTALQVPTVW